jgi:hypothetical protein
MVWPGGRGLIGRLMLPSSPTSRGHRARREVAIVA